MKTKRYFRVELCLYEYEEVLDPENEPNMEAGDVVDSDLLEEEPFFLSENKQDAYDTLEFVQNLLVSEKIDNLPPPEGEEG